VFDRLPVDCAFSLEGGGAVLFVIERRPRNVVITQGARRFKLSFPFLQFFVPVGESGVLDPVHVTCTVEPLESGADDLFLPPLPNVHHDGRICFGQVESRGKLSEKVWESAGLIPGRFLESAFNNDLSKTGLDPRMKDLAEWEKASAANPLFALGVKYERLASFAGLVAKYPQKFGKPATAANEPRCVSL
jgi:hypothetical protein